MEAPIRVYGKIQGYQVKVEARLDEDENAIEILTEFAPGEGIQKAEGVTTSPRSTLS